MPMSTIATTRQKIPNQRMLAEHQPPENNKRAKVIITSLVVGILVIIGSVFSANQYHVQQSQAKLTDTVLSYDKAKPNKKLSNAKDVLSIRQSIEE
jgi:hypothetical protein